MWNSSSLEQINTQFKSIMENMGIDEERQHKLSTKLNLAKKIKTITSMQTLDERKKKIKEYIAKLSDRNSVLNLLSLSCSLESGPKILYEIFKEERGPEVLAKCVKCMDGEFSDALCDAISMILFRYGNEFPPFLEALLASFVGGRIREHTSFFKILEYLAKSNGASELFLAADHNNCTCSTYLSRIIAYIRHLPSVDSEINFILPLLKSERAAQVRYILLVSKFNELVEKMASQKVFSEIAALAKFRASRSSRPDRIHEILKVAEERGMTDVVCCIAEGLIFGDRSLYGEIEKDAVRGMEEIRREVRVLEEKLFHRGTAGDIETDPAEKLPVRKESGHKPAKKILKKAAKKNAGPTKNYMQVNWEKMPKGDSIWKSVDLKEAQSLFSEADFDVFERRKEAGASRLSTEVRREAVFSEKKNYAINIALGRVRISNRELKQAILSLKADFDVVLIKQLLCYFPTDAEIKQLGETEEPFGRAEEFFKECIDEIDQVKSSMYYIYFIMFFKKQNIQKALKTLGRYYQGLLNNQHLRRFLAAVLYAGNFLNQGTFLGNAEGFVLRSLPAILEMKTRGTTFMEFVRGRVDCDALLESLGCINEASHINFEGLCAEMEELRKNYTNAHGSPYEEIQKKLDEVVDEYENINTEFEAMLRLNNECRIYFGESVGEDFNNRMVSLIDKLKGKPPV
jgi:dishevelled associated activator of morphogenesis